MRKDMAKVLVERPRKGGCGKARIRQNRRDTKLRCKDFILNSETEFDSYRGMKKVHTSTPYSWDDTKALNENLKPLRRFLRSRIGSPWNEVYSEIMENLNLNNAVQYHVHQHLIDHNEVFTKTFMDGNTIMAHSYGGPEPIRKFSYREQFYVDPRDGTLRCMDNSPRWRQPKAESSHPNWVFEKNNPLEQFHKIKGSWFKFTFREPTDEERKRKSFGTNQLRTDALGISKVWWMQVERNHYCDQIFEERNIQTRGYYARNFWERCTMAFGSPLLPIKKQQISSREVRRIERKLEKQK